MTLHDTIISQGQTLVVAFGGEQNALVSTRRDVADHAVDGEILFEFLGERFVPVGRKEIDWQAPQHAHQEWVAQLNRFFQWPPLALAYAETGEERYAEAARDYLVAWMAAHPTQVGWAPAPYDNTLNLAIRVQQWALALPRLLASPTFDDVLLVELLASIDAQCGYLCDHLTPASNWRIAQADALLTCGVAFPDQAGAARWRALGVCILNDAYHRQILPDGVHTERNPAYHWWMTDVFERYWQLGRAIPALGLCLQTEVISRMHDYCLATTRPNGASCALHDDVGRRTGPYDDRVAAARARFRRSAGLPETMPSTAQFFPEAGQVFIRDGWTPDATYVTFDASTWGGGHCHLGRNAVQLHAGGRTLLPDPGYLTYDARDPMMPYGKSTRAHNNLTINGWNQSEANPEGTRCLACAGYHLAASRYIGGYWPGRYEWHYPDGHGAGVFGLHHRLLLWLPSGVIVVVDHLTTEMATAPAVEVNWQLAEGAVAVDGNRAITQHPDANLLLLFAALPPGVEISVHAGERDPLRGWLPGDGGYVPAPQVCVSGVLPAPDTRFTTVLLPFAGIQPPDLTATVTTLTGGAEVLRLLWTDDSVDEVVHTPCLLRAIDRYADLDTDAALVHRHFTPQGSMNHGLVVDGSYCAPYVTVRRMRSEAFGIRG